MTTKERLLDEAKLAMKDSPVDLFERIGGFAQSDKIALFWGRRRCENHGCNEFRNRTANGECLMCAFCTGCLACPFFHFSCCPDSTPLVDCADKVCGDISQVGCGVSCSRKAWVARNAVCSTVLYNRKDSKYVIWTNEPAKTAWQSDIDSASNPDSSTVIAIEILNSDRQSLLEFEQVRAILRSSSGVIAAKWDAALHDVGRFLGTVVASAPTAPKSSSRFCSSCGAPVPTASAFCSGCGARV